MKNCSKAIELDPEYLKALLRRAEIYEETDKLGMCPFPVTARYIYKKTKP